MRNRINIRIRIKKLATEDTEYYQYTSVCSVANNLGGEPREKVGRPSVCAVANLLEREIKIHKPRRPHRLAVADERLELPFADRVLCRSLQETWSCRLLNFANIAGLADRHLD